MGLRLSIEPQIDSTGPYSVDHFCQFNQQQVATLIRNGLDVDLTLNPMELPRLTEAAIDAPPQTGPAPSVMNAAHLDPKSIQIVWLSTSSATGTYPLPCPPTASSTSPLRPYLSFNVSCSVPIFLFIGTLQLEGADDMGYPVMLPLTSAPQLLLNIPFPPHPALSSHIGTDALTLWSGRNPISSSTSSSDSPRPQISSASSSPSTIQAPSLTAFTAGPSNPIAAVLASSSSHRLTLSPGLDHAILVPLSSLFDVALTSLNTAHRRLDAGTSRALLRSPGDPRYNGNTTSGTGGGYNHAHPDVLSQKVIDEWLSQLDVDSLFHHLVIQTVPAIPLAPPDLSNPTKGAKPKSEDRQEGNQGGGGDDDEGLFALDADLEAGFRSSERRDSWQRENDRDRGRSRDGERRRRRGAGGDGGSSGSGSSSSSSDANTRIGVQTALETAGYTGAEWTFVRFNTIVSSSSPSTTSSSSVPSTATTTTATSTATPTAQPDFNHVTIPMSGSSSLPQHASHNHSAQTVSNTNTNDPATTSNTTASTTATTPIPTSPSSLSAILPPSGRATFSVRSVKQIVLADSSLCLVQDVYGLNEQSDQASSSSSASSSSPSPPTTTTPATSSSSSLLSSLDFKDLEVAVTAPIAVTKRAQVAITADSTHLPSPSTSPTTTSSTATTATTSAHQSSSGTLIVYVGSPSSTSPTTSDSASSTSRVQECVICMAAPGSVINLPCRHLCTCSACAQELITNGAGQSKCPICREKLSRVIMLREDENQVG